MKKIHFLGIGGSGASAIAAIAQAQGYQVSGCDRNIDNEFTKPFSSNQLEKGHSSSHFQDIDLLVITPAILSLDPNNEELEEAKKQNIPVLTWQQFMGEYLEKGKFVIAICGTHGKSTTTAMIAKVLVDANLDPTVELGAIIPEWGANFRIGKSEIFITEADEFNDNFLATIPDIAVVTSIEMDHPEYFKDLEAVKESFDQFISQTKKSIIANLTNEGVADVVKDVMKHSSASAIDYTKTEINLNLKIPGDFNILNAKAAFQVGLLLGLDPQKMIASLDNYSGISRRFEHIGKLRGADIYSDFAHHPTAIKVTLEAAREKFPDRTIKVIFQPHMFSRTKALYDDFVKVFKSAPVDQVVIMDIYPSREIDTGLVKSEQLVGTINKESVTYNSPDQLKETIAKDIKSGDVVIFMGAGDADNIARKIVEKN